MSVKQSWKNAALLIWEMHPAINYNQGRLWESNSEGQVWSLVYWFIGEGVTQGFHIIMMIVQWNTWRLFMELSNHVASVQCIKSADSPVNVTSDFSDVGVRARLDGLCISETPGIFFTPRQSLELFTECTTMSNLVADIPQEQKTPLRFLDYQSEMGIWDYSGLRLRLSCPVPLIVISECLDISLLYLKPQSSKNTIFKYKNKYILLITCSSWSVLLLYLLIIHLLTLLLAFKFRLTRRPFLSENLYSGLIMSRVLSLILELDLMSAPPFLGSLWVTTVSSRQSKVWRKWLG